MERMLLERCLALLFFGLMALEMYLIIQAALNM